MISARCPNCRREYQVKDEFAGKKFRCKDCEAAVVVPDGGAARGGGSSRSSGSATRSSARSRPAKRSLDDQLDELRRADADDYDYADDDDEPVLRPQRAAKSSRRSGSGGGSGSMPGPVIAFLVIEALAFLKNGLNVVAGLLLIVQNLLAASFPIQQVGITGIWTLALAANLYVGLGTWNRKSGARTMGIVMAILGGALTAIVLAIGAIFGVGMLALSGGGAGSGDVRQSEFSGALAGVGAGMLCIMIPGVAILALYVAQVVLLFRPSAVRYYR